MKMDAQEEVISIELAAPPSWKKMYFPKRTGTPRKNEIMFISPTGEEINNRKQLEQYLRSHHGSPALSGFDWGTGETPRRSARISEKVKASPTPETEPLKKRSRKSLGSKKDNKEIAYVPVKAEGEKESAVKEKGNDVKGEDQMDKGELQEANELKNVDAREKDIAKAEAGKDGEMKEDGEETKKDDAEKGAGEAQEQRNDSAAVVKPYENVGSVEVAEDGKVEDSASKKEGQATGIEETQYAVEAQEHKNDSTAIEKPSEHAGSVEVAEDGKEKVEDSASSKEEQATSNEETQYAVEAQEYKNDSAAVEKPSENTVSAKANTIDGEIVRSGKVNLMGRTDGTHPTPPVSC